VAVLSAEPHLLGVGPNESANPQGGYGSLLRKFGLSDLEADPVYQTGLKFGLDTGKNAINQRAIAGGGYNSGATLKLNGLAAGNYNIEWWDTLTGPRETFNASASTGTLVVAVPVIGHATWHAYRDLVDTDGVPPRQ
jgi:hypothetical protein